MTSQLSIQWKRGGSMQEKTFKEIFEKLLSERISDEFAETLGGYIKQTGKKISVYDAMAMVQMKKALDGDVKSFELIRETIGQKEHDEKSDFGGVVRVLISDE